MNRRNRTPWILFALIGFMWIAGLDGCSCNGTPENGDTVAATSGGGQSTPINTAFPEPLVVTVTNHAGSAVSGVVVTFAAPGTGASATFSSATATTNAMGVAQVTATANGTAGGPYNVTASIPSGKSVDFSLTNTSTSTAAQLGCTSGSGQSVAVNTEFANPLIVQVEDSDGNPVDDSGVSVTFTPPATGASATLGTNPATTGANGQASTTATANGMVGSDYIVSASASINGTQKACNFTLTNTSSTVTTENFTFYLNGLEAINEGLSLSPNFYALAGVVTINTTTGDVTGGEQDYNDGLGLSTFEPDPVPISGGQLSINSNGQGTLTLDVGDTNLGNAGVETLGVQFVNNDHALVIQFDGSATSSGSMDLQTSTAGQSGTFAFTFSGVNGTDDCSTVTGGVFSINGTSLQNGTIDFDDECSQPASTGLAFTGTVTAPDGLGRGTITGTAGINALLAYYVVGPKVMRIIDIDFDDVDTGVGSAYSQGTTAFSNASLTGSSATDSAVFEFESNSWANTLYAAAGMLTTSNTGTTPANFIGVADDNEDGNLFPDKSISGIYTVNVNDINGYGSLILGTSSTCNGSLGDVCALGVYMVDPTLNISDPNNTTTGLGGALVADLDTIVGTGILVPQTDTSAASFSGNYAFGAQDYNSVGAAGWEFDFLGQGNFTTFFEDAPGLISDPFAAFDTGSPQISNATFSITPQADEENAGRYIPSALTITPPIPSLNPTQLQTIVYQSYGGLLVWVDENDSADSIVSIFGGSIQQQTLPLTLPLASVKVKPAAAQPQSTK